MGDAESRRWAGYLNATVVADIEGARVVLLGRGATLEWPFGGPVHALTAWDPAGEKMDRAVNDTRNRLLHADLVSAGYSVWDSAGYDRDGEFVDQGFAVPGADESRILQLAADCGQEAIYRFDSDTVTVISTAHLGGTASMSVDERIQSVQQQRISQPSD
ncbi:MAG: DUF3293 domain-containing protein [Microthrixaceae bacterium]